MVTCARRKACRRAAANVEVRVASPTGRSSQGNQARLRSLQAKLAVSQPGDAAEREADRVADHVMRTPNSALLFGSGDQSSEANAKIHVSPGDGIAQQPLIQRDTPKTAPPPPAAPAFPVSGNASCFCDKGDTAGGKGAVACGGQQGVSAKFNCPDEKDKFAAWKNVTGHPLGGSSKSLPEVACGDMLTVSSGGRQVDVQVVDSGPGDKNRIIDLSLAAAKELVDPAIKDQIKSCRSGKLGDEHGNLEVTVTKVAPAAKP